MEPVLDKKKQEQKQSIEPPKRYNVVILNDDFTTHDVVVEICTTFFGKTSIEADKITFDVHTKGKAAVGTFPKDVAETKSAIATEFARLNECPLVIQAEEE